MRQVMEGKRLLPHIGLLNQSLCSTQAQRRQTLKGKYIEARDNNQAFKLEDKLKWQRELSDAASAGHLSPSVAMFPYTPNTPVFTLLNQLRIRQKARLPIQYNELKRAVNQLIAALKVHDEVSAKWSLGKDLSWLHQQLDNFVSRNGKFGSRIVAIKSNLLDAASCGRANYQGRSWYRADSDAALLLARLRDIPVTDPAFYRHACKTASALAAAARANDQIVEFDILADDRDFLLSLFDYFKEIWDALELSRYRDLQTAYAAPYIGPTLMGNVAESIQHYALSRYGLDLDTYWTRLQLVIPSNRLCDALQNAKTQLDFLVACFWLTILTWIPWTGALIFQSHSVLAFLAVAIGGPMIAAIFYELAVTSYANLGDLIKSAVDLSRFSLLKSLHLPAPTTLGQERQIWENLRDHASFGKPVDMTYDATAKDSPL